MSFLCVCFQAGVKVDELFYHAIRRYRKTMPHGSQVSWIKKKATSAILTSQQKKEPVNGQIDYLSCISFSV